MIETDRLVLEMLSVMSYAKQTLRLHPEKVDLVERHLTMEHNRLINVVKDREDNLDILMRVVVY